MSLAVKVRSLLLVVAPIALFAWMVSFEVRKRKSFPINLATVPSAKKLIETWENREFFDVSSDEAWDAIEKIPFIDQEPILEDSQRTLLHKEVARFLKAYNTGSFEDFVAFRFPTTNGLWNTGVLAEDKRFLTKQLQVSSKIYEEKNPFVVIKTVWDHPRSRLCTNCIQRFSIQDASILISKRKEVPGPMNVKVFYNFYNPPGKTNYFRNIHGVGSRFSFSPSPPQIAAKNGHFVEASLWMVISTSQGGSHPIFLRFYWDPGSSKWLPLSLVVCTARPENEFYMF